jgi:hypothetical protein
MDRGHQFILLPPYHSQYTPVELVWAQVKLEVAKKKRIFKISDVKTLLFEELEKLTHAEYHAIKLQEDDYSKDDHHQLTRQAEADESDDTTTTTVLVKMMTMTTTRR